jgi:hypothetical protein
MSRGETGASQCRQRVDSPSSGRALVAIEADRPETHPHRHLYNAAAFVAQLIANVRGLPQARERRRADPAEVIAAYRATIERIRELN